MNATDKLQLIRAIEEQEASHRRRSDWFAWGSVLLAAFVLSVMILVGRGELREINGELREIKMRVSNTREELAATQKELAFAKANSSSCTRKRMML